MSSLRLAQRWLGCVRKEMTRRDNAFTFQFSDHNPAAEPRRRLHKVVAAAEVVLHRLAQLLALRQRSNRNAKRNMYWPLQ